MNLKPLKNNELFCVVAKPKSPKTVYNFEVPIVLEDKFEHEDTSTQPIPV